MNIKRFYYSSRILLQASLLALVLISSYSCVPVRKLKYLQDIEKKQIPESDSFNAQFEIYRLRPYDIVNVTIKSVDKKYEEMFNVVPVTTQSINIEASDIFYLNGFLLNDSGYVNLPIIGKLQISGLTLNEAEKKIQEALLQYITYVYVNLKIGGVRYSILGEVRAPGKYMIMQSSVSIFDAISRAGDLTEFAKRDDIHILRKISNTEVKMIKINMLDKNIVNSNMYYIKPDDIIYIPPLKVKQYGIGSNGFQTLTGILTVMSSLLIMYSLIQQ